MPKSPIAAVIPIPQDLASDNATDNGQKAALDAISQIAAGVDAAPKPRGVAGSRQDADDPNGFLAFF